MQIRVILNAYRIRDPIKKWVDDKMLNGVVLQTNWTLPLRQPRNSENVSSYPSYLCTLITITKTSSNLITLTAISRVNECIHAAMSEN